MNRELLSREERDFILTHVAYALLCAVALVLPLGLSSGVRIFLLVLIYIAAIPLLGMERKHRDWIDIWLFCLFLSLLQVFPDWFLSAVLDVLVFSEKSPFVIGAVSGYMAVLWTIPLFIIIFIGERARTRRSEGAAYVAVAISSLIIFGASEAMSWRLSLWQAKEVFMIGHLALYIIVPEVVLGTTAYFAYRITRDRGLVQKWAAAFLVMTSYLGGAALFYLVVERIILSR